jgi:hypothetical protein
MQSMPNPKFLRTQERYYSLHHQLFQIACIALKDALTSKVGQDLNVLKTITFSALAAEAFLNGVGFRTEPDWKSFERRATGEKMKDLCGHLNVPFDKNSNPWQALDCLFELRNDIVHGKPEHLKTEHVLPEIAIDKTKFDIPQSGLEKQLTIGNAQRFLQATKEMYERFRLVIPQDVAFEIFQDGWSGSVTVL